MYDLRPKINGKCQQPIFKDKTEIIQELNELDFQILAIECYPGTDIEFLRKEIIDKMPNVQLFDAADVLLSVVEVNELVGRELTDDELFGRFINQPFSNYLHSEKVYELNQRAQMQRSIVYGVGASRIVKADKIIYVNISRWQIQLRYKKGMANWQCDNAQETWDRKIKRGYYLDWPLGDQIKEECLKKFDYMIDLNNANTIKMIHASDYLSNIQAFTEQPFRLVPYFAPGVWGGNWMQNNFGAGKEEQNLAWAFDGVPEENSIIFDIDGYEFEFPANDIVLLFPKQLMGELTYGRYGKNFPIRFDYLDTMGGQNLSLQVHPTTEYAYKNFGALYTQDESYYIMECGPEAKIYLGLKNGVKKEDLIIALRKAQKTQTFDTDKFIGTIAAKKHDHFSIPAGTVHCSGAGCLVLEISATPNRFTFKLWDWNRVDLDGKPRPINIERGKNNIDESYDTDFVNRFLYNPLCIVKNEKNHKIESTGLYISEPLVTYRDTFNSKIKNETNGNVQMLCLVEGEEITVSLTEEGMEKNLIVHYGETFIVPANTRCYYMEPSGKSKGKYVKTMKAQVR